jgi:hypothetical protein
MFSRWRSVFMPEIVARRYRGIIFTLVLVNTALIVFLVVYIWTYAPYSPDTSQRKKSGLKAKETEINMPEMTVAADNLILWSRPGGAKAGGASRGILDKGITVLLLDSTDFDSEKWYNVGLEGRDGWVQARGVN